MEGNTLLLLLLLLCFIPGTPGQQPPENDAIREVKALMAIKEELTDPQNALSSWESNSADPCNWNHVYCSSKKMIIDLELPGLQLAGTLSSSVGDLIFLQSLKLENNNLSGPIPEAIGNLSKLDYLDLSNNHFSGQVPACLGQLMSLNFLQLKNNSFSGPLPMELGEIPSLHYVDLSFNNLSGNLPNFTAKAVKLIGNPLLCGFNNRVCPGEPLLAPSTTSGSRLGKNQVTTIVVVVPAFGALCVAAFLWRWRRKQIHLDSVEQDDPEICLGQVKKFTFRELKSATDNFHPRNVLGSGGFGIVYKGSLSDGTVVAVKRLKDRNAVAGGEAQFHMEVRIISLALHRNLLHLLGYCITSSERLLIYRYMPNGSVALRLRDKPALDWSIRKRIALGSARGLAYLHEQCDPKIIHRDVKAANILLDEDYEAVVGDFGLAKLLDHTESHVTTAVRGTVGHIAPEYLSTGQSSDKTDVFGFGILLLELITGQRAIDFGQKFNQRGYALLDWARCLLHEGEVHKLVDTELKEGVYESAEVEEMVQIALLCTQLHPSDRPKMSEVVRMLEGDDALLERWEASRASEMGGSFGVDRSPQRYYDLAIDSTFVLDAVELSGPR